MHEYGIASEIIKAVESYVKANKADKPLGCWVQFGPLCGINPEALENAFPLAAKGTICEDTEMNAFVEPVVCKCRDCDAKTQLTEYTEIMLCGKCGSINIECPPSSQRIYLSKLKLQRGGDVFIIEFKNVEMEEEHHHD